MTRRHALAQPGLFCDGTLRCGISGDVISLGGKRFGVITDKHYLYYLAAGGETVTCKNCITQRTPSDETRRKLSLAKLGNQNARRHNRPQHGRQA